MREYSLHFYSETPCNVFINGEQIGLIDNKNQFYIDVIVFNSTLIVSSEPICEKNNIFIPISFKLEYENETLTCSSNNIKIVPFPNNNYDVILKFKSSPMLNNASIYSKKVGANNVLAMLDYVSTISVFNGDKNLFTTKQGMLKNLQAKEIGNLILITAEAEQNETFLLAFNQATNTPLICDLFIKLEKVGDEIKCLKNLHNTLLTGKVFKLNLKTLELETFNVFLESENKVLEANLIPYSFLEAVKEDNFNLATTFLNEKLLHSSPYKLKQFFKHFNEIYYNCYYLKSDVFNYTILGDEPRNFNFYLVDNKIAEIEEVSLTQHQIN